MVKLFSLLIGCILVLTGCSSSESELTSVTVMLDYTPNTNHIGVYNAIEEGYYTEVGLDVEVIQVTDVSVETVVAQNEAQFGFSYQENVSMAIDQGMPIQSIYGVYNQNTSGIMYRSETDITKDELTYCGWGSDVEAAIINYIADFTNKTINITNSSLGFSNTPVSAGCDIFWEYEGWATEEAKINNIAYEYIPITEFGIDFYSPVIISNDEVSDEVKTDFITATNKGYMYASTNPDESVANFMSQNPDVNEELITNSLAVLAPSFNSTGKQEETIWKNFSQFLIDEEIVSSEFDYTNAYTNEFIKE